MLAANSAFLTPEQLHLTQNQHDVLRRLLSRIECGLIQDAPQYHVERGEVLAYAGNFLDLFDYATVYTRYEKCGAVGCLLGWARVLDPMAAADNCHRGEFTPDNAPEQLSVLFFENFQGPNSRGLTVAEAGRALRQYLETGRGKYHAE